MLLKHFLFPRCSIETNEVGKFHSTIALNLRLEIYKIFGFSLESNLKGTIRIKRHGMKSRTRRVIHVKPQTIYNARHESFRGKNKHLILEIVSDTDTIELHQCIESVITRTARHSPTVVIVVILEKNDSLTLVNARFTSLIDIA